MSAAGEFEPRNVQLRVQIFVAELSLAIHQRIQSQIQ